MVFPILTDSQLQFSSITAPVHTEGIYFLLEAHLQVESIEEGIDSPGRRQAK